MSAAALYATAFAAGWEPDPELTVSEWADLHRQLTGVGSAEKGAWRTSRTPYLREIMDAISPGHPARRVVLMKGSQIGATECGNNWLGYIIHHAPGPMLMVQPTVELAKRSSKLRIAPMIEACPELRSRVKEARSRDSGNTTFVKEFPNGVLVLTGANSGAGLRSTAARYLFLDEVDSYPGDLEGEGDPIRLAERAIATFARNSKTLMTSTPTIKCHSRIEREYLRTDQRRYFVPCPFCGEFDWIRFKDRIRWDEGEPWTAYLACLACGGRIEESRKSELLERGEWRPTAAGQRDSIGFHLSALYSPFGWKSWAECATEFYQAEKDRDVPALKTWTNLVLGETWEDRGEEVEPDALMARRERYAAEVPSGVGILVAAVDVQDNRLECVVKGYGAAEESWLIAFHQFMGDPAREQPWYDLDTFLQQEWAHESGRKMKIECAAIDSGGHHTEMVYRFCRARLGRRVFAVRGSQERGKPIIGQPSMHNRYRTPLYSICVDTAKGTVLARLRIGSPGPGYVHLPEWVEGEYVAQITAERPVWRYAKGRGTARDWVKIRERNEAFDLEVYALAALYILGPAVVRTLPDRAARMSAPVKGAEPTQAAPGPVQSALPAALVPRPRRGGWVNRW
jgi:phage terminase large subunit GpA-like protein